MAKRPYQMPDDVVGQMAYDVNTSIRRTIAVDLAQHALHGLGAANQSINAWVLLLGFVQR